MNKLMKNIFAPKSSMVHIHCVNLNFNHFRQFFKQCKKKRKRKKLFVHKPIRVYFSNIEAKLISHIDASTYCVGCVAWMTNRHIIEAMANLKGCMMVVQNDCINTNQARLYKKLPHLYNNIPADLVNKIMQGKYHTLQRLFHICQATPNDDAVCLCGFDKPSGTMYQPHQQPLMHHKFLVFFNSQLRIKGVWTGSYNFTFNANQSFENGIFITDKNTIMKYLKEFILVMQSSHHLSHVNN